MVKRFDELKVQRQYGNIFDFCNASEKTFREIVEKIPDSLRLKVNEINNCGIPLTLQGFGFAVDQGLLASIFGEEAYKNLINDLGKVYTFKIKDLIGVDAKGKYYFDVEDYEVYSIKNQ